MSNPDPKVETLFAHPSVRIVCFSAGSTASSSVREDDEAGTLSWTSPLERVIAVGPLRIYQTPGSVAFLNCGNVIQAIFPKSRCWCVDDASTKFVLQMRRPQYWRIEIPNPYPIDLGVLAELKRTLSQILQFEKTACPFRRNFTIELPEVPAKPVKKRPWKPLKIPTRTDEARYVQSTPEVDPEEIYFSAASNDDRACRKAESYSGNTDDTDLTPRNPLPRSTYQYMLGKDDLNSKKVARTSRSVTEPPQLNVFTSLPSKTVRSESPRRRSGTPVSRSSNFSSMDSFHTVESWHSPISPSPPSPHYSIPTSPTTYPYPHDNTSLSKLPNNRDDDASEITVTPETPRVWETSRRFRTKSTTDEAEEYPTPPPRTPTLIDDTEDSLDEECFEVVTPPVSGGRIRRRRTPTNNPFRHTLPPPLPARNLSSPSRQHPRRLRTARHLPTAIIQKTCEILLSPPSYLVRLMLDIASKITAGEWRGMIFGFGERGEKIVGQWDYGDGDVEDEWGEDDYGISLGGNQAITKRSNATVANVGGSWEID